MSRSIQILVFCDTCQEAGIKEPGVELEPIQVGNAKPITLALCEGHMRDAKTFLSMLAAGTPSQQFMEAPLNHYKSRAKNALPCPFCESVLKNTDSLYSHARQMHGKRVPETRAALEAR